MLTAIVVILFLVIVVAAACFILWIIKQAQQQALTPVSDSIISQLNKEMTQDSLPNIHPEIGDMPILEQYKAVITGDLTLSDQQRLIRLKRAADAVYGYYDWIATDFRRQEDEKKHNSKIAALVQDVMACLELSQFQKSLASYFTACVLTEIKEEFIASGPTEVMFPINLQVFENDCVNPEEVIDLMHQRPDHEVMYYAGIFIPQGYPLSNIDAMTKVVISNGGIVYSDDVLTMTDNLVDIVEAKFNKPYSETTEEEHFEAFKDAIEVLYQTQII